MIKEGISWKVARELKGKVELVKKLNGFKEGSEVKLQDKSLKSWGMPGDSLRCSQKAAKGP